MQLPSDRFTAAISDSHTMAGRIDVLERGLVIASTDFGGEGEFAVQATGGVTCDGSAAIRRRSDFTLIDPDHTLTPLVAEDLFSNLSSHELRIWRGIRYDDGAEELFKLGTFDIAQSVSTSEASGLQIKVSGYDRARALQRAKWTQPYYVQEQQNYITAIEHLIQDRLDNQGFRAESTIHVTPFQTYSEGSDPLQAAIDMATSIGMELFVDVDGTWVIRSVPDPATAIVSWTYREGDESVLLSVENTSDNERVFNGQIVIGDSSSGFAPPRAEVWDTDPNSPTYYQGPYGRVPDTTNDPRVLNDAQALAEATLKFRQNKGFARTIHFEIIPNPIHDFLDVVWITRAANRVDGAFMLDTWTVPLSATERMSITTRERRS